MTLTKEILVKYIQNQTGFQLYKCRVILEIILDEIASSLRDGSEVKISSFGKWQVHKKKSRKARHPASGDLIQIDQRAVVLFYPSKILRNLLNTDVHPHNKDAYDDTHIHQDWR